MPRITLRVACAQLRARPLAQARAALDDMCAAIARAARARAQLVVLPECSYPGYVLLNEHPFESGIPSAEHALRRLGESAARHEVMVCAGVARTDSRGRLHNEAVLIDRDGRLVGTYAKNYLWGFDSRWFRAGDSLPVFQTRVGTLGIMICADGRLPEIPRALAAGGAWLILDPTAWVSYGTSYASMKNPQADFMLRIRAQENAVWIAAADKCGSENEAVYYVGRSQIVAPDGSVAALASADRPEIVHASVGMPARRRIFHRRFATHAVGATGASVDGRVAQRGDRDVVWLGLCQLRAASGRHDRMFATLRAQGAEAIVRSDASVAASRAALRACPKLRAVVLEGRALLAPESPRAAARNGADVIVWLRPPPRVPVLEFARTRALENRVYVAVCVPPRADVSTALVDPDGTVVAAALRNANGAIFAAVTLAAARRKTVVPGTDALAVART